MFLMNYHYFISDLSARLLRITNDEANLARILETLEKIEGLYNDIEAFRESKSDENLSQKLKNELIKLGMFFSKISSRTYDLRDAHKEIPWVALSTFQYYFKEEDSDILNFVSSTKGELEILKENISKMLVEAEEKMAKYQNMSVNLCYIHQAFESARKLLKYEADVYNIVKTCPGKLKDSHTYEIIEKSRSAYGEMDSSLSLLSPEIRENELSEIFDLLHGIEGPKFLIEGADILTEGSASNDLEKEINELEKITTDIESLSLQRSLVEEVFPRKRSEDDNYFNIKSRISDYVKTKNERLLDDVHQRFYLEWSNLSDDEKSSPASLKAVSRVLEIAGECAKHLEEEDLSDDKAWYRELKIARNVLAHSVNTPYGRAKLFHLLKVDSNLLLRAADAFIQRDVSGIEALTEYLESHIEVDEAENQFKTSPGFMYWLMSMEDAPIQSDFLTLMANQADVVWMGEMAKDVEHDLLYNQQVQSFQDWIQELISIRINYMHDISEKYDGRFDFSKEDVGSFLRGAAIDDSFSGVLFDMSECALERQQYVSNLLGGYHCHQDMKKLLKFFNKKKCKLNKTQEFDDIFLDSFSIFCYALYEEQLQNHTVDGLKFENIFRYVKSCMKNKIDDGNDDKKHGEYKSDDVDDPVMTPPRRGKIEISDDIFLTPTKIVQDAIDEFQNEAYDIVATQYFVESFREKIDYWYDVLLAMRSKGFLDLAEGLEMTLVYYQDEVIPSITERIKNQPSERPDLSDRWEDDKHYQTPDGKRRAMNRASSNKKRQERPDVTEIPSSLLSQMFLAREDNKDGDFPVDLSNSTLK